MFFLHRTSWSPNATALVTSVRKLIRPTNRNKTWKVASTKVDGTSALRKRLVRTKGRIRINSLDGRKVGMNGRAQVSGWSTHKSRLACLSYHRRGLVRHEELSNRFLLQRCGEVNLLVGPSSASLRAGTRSRNFPQTRLSMAAFPQHESLHSHFESSPDIL